MKTGIIGSELSKKQPATFDCGLSSIEDLIVVSYEQQ